MLDRIAQILEWLVGFFQSLYQVILRLVNGTIDFFSAILKIISTLWYGATSLFTSVIDLVNQVFSGSLFNELYTGFNSLSLFLGVGSILFVSTLLYVIIFRIGVAFVFKVLRLNIDYKKEKLKH